MTAFIDVHCHPPIEAFHRSFAPYLSGVEAIFGRKVPVMTPAELADYYASRDGRAVVLGWDAETATRMRPITNRDIAALVDTRPDVFVGFGSVDPRKGEAAVAGVHEAARLGLKGLKLHPAVQGFHPTGRPAMRVWETAAGHGLVCLVHTGYTAMGAGMPGGAGVVLEYGRPAHLDVVAARFPELRIIAAHPAWPWHEESVAVARHKPNVYLELSGWSPRRIPQSFLSAALGDLSERTVFGTDFPFLEVDRWLASWRKLDVPPEVERRILHDNAAELLDI